tara:strand:+ start:476 stop:1441 length:966 start_codon:yes stop_codon:yes gene_type:complete
VTKLIKTNPEDLLNLQSGNFAHFVEEGIAINDVKTFEPRHQKNEIHKTSNVRGLRLTLNIIFSVVVFTTALLTGFYPLSLLLFLSLYDLRGVKRINLPINKSNFIPYKNIEEVKMVKGILNLSYAHIIIVDDKGKRSLKKLKLYDSQSGWNRAVLLFERIGKLNLKREPIKDISDLKKITIGNGIEYAIEKDKLLLIENNKFNKDREDPFKYFRFVALIGLSGTLGAAAVKIRKIIEDHEYEVVHFTVVALFLALTLIPLKYLRKTKPTEVKKSDVKDFRITKKHFVIIMKGWKGFSLVIKHDLKYFTEEGIDELKAYLSS